MAKKDWLGKIKISVGIAEKAKEFTESGSEIYHGNIPDGGREHH